MIQMFYLLNQCFGYIGCKFFNIIDLLQLIFAGTAS